MLASEFLKYKNWVVVGDVLNSSKYAYRILLALKEAGYNVVGVNPSADNEEIYKSLEEVPFQIDIIDLCINPYKGINIVNEAASRKVEKVLIQPGAESDEILSFCKKNNLNAVCGCALVELSNR